MNKNDKTPWETVVSTTPVFLKVADAPVGVTVPEICEAAEAKIGFDTIAGAVRKPTVWRLYGKRPENKAKLLEGINPHIVIRKQVDNDHEYKDFVIPLYSKNPMSNSIGPDGKIIPSIRLSIDGLFLSVSMEDVKKTLEKIPGLVMKSPIYFDRAFKRNKTLSRFVNGRRFVYIDEPAENAPLPPTIKVGAFQASLFYRGMPLRCWDCFGPHRKGDKSCPKYANQFYKSSDKKKTQNNPMNVHRDELPGVTMAASAHPKTTGGQTDETVEKLLQDLRRSPQINFNTKGPSKDSGVVGSGNHENVYKNAKTNRVNMNINMNGKSAGDMLADNHPSDEDSDSTSSQSQDGQSSSDVASDEDSDGGQHSESGTDGWDDKLPSYASDTDGWDDYLHHLQERQNKTEGNSPETDDLESRDTPKGSVQGVASNADVEGRDDSVLDSDTNISAAPTGLCNEGDDASSDDMNSDFGSDCTLAGSGRESDSSMSGNSSANESDVYFTPSIDNHSRALSGVRQEDTPVKCANHEGVMEDVRLENVNSVNNELQGQTERLRSRLMSDPDEQIMDSSQQADEPLQGAFMMEMLLSKNDASTGNESDERLERVIKKSKRYRKKRGMHKNVSTTNIQPPITQHFKSNVYNKRVFNTSSSEGDKEFPRPPKNLKKSMASPVKGGDES